MGEHDGNTLSCTPCAISAYILCPIDESNYAELASRMEVYISEFEKHGTDNILVNMDS